MVIVYSLMLLATAGAAGAYVWMKKPGYIVKQYLRYYLYRTGLHIKHVRVGDYTFTYAERGLQGKSPSLLLVHGFSSSKDMWVPVVKKLPRELHIVVVDLPGHGDSSIPSEGDDISLPVFARNLKQFADTIGLSEHPFHIAGCSMGGAIVAIYAASYPDDLAKVTLVCPAMRTPKLTAFQQEVQAGVCRLLPSTTQEFQEMLDLCAYKKVKLNRMILEGCLQLREHKNKFYRRLFESMVATDNSEEGRRLEEKTSEIQVPTQLMWGRHDQVIHPSGIKLLRERLSSLQRVDILEECGHSCSMERPGQVAKLLMAFRNQATSQECGNQTNDSGNQSKTDNGVASQL